MLFAKIIDNKVVAYPFTEQMLRDENPNTSFPAYVTPEMAAEFGMVLVQETEPPVVDLTKNLVDGTPKKIGGIWVQDWNVISASDDEIAARMADAWRVLRENRNQLLSGTDWTMLMDAPVANQKAWRDYRQALRDLPSNTTDPANPVWPTIPA